MAPTASARARRTSRRRAAGPVLPDDLVVWEILVRLPAKELLRCRSWRRLTSDDDFLLAHHRRQPSLPLVTFHGQVSRGSGLVTDASVDAFDIRRYPAERRPVLGFNDYNHRRNFTIQASCDGLLLSLSNNRFYICNLATRQWAALPNLTGSTVAALYPHHLSGEYRVLYWKGDSCAVYYVLTVGSSEKPRCIGLPVALESMKKVMPWGLINARANPPVLLHGCLHWVSGCTIRNKLIVFDMVVESFRWMRSPTAVVCADLLEMDGKLGISRVNDSSRMTKAIVWVLQDYKKEAWSLKYRIELSATEMTSITESKYFYGNVVSENGDVLVACRFPWYMFHFDSKGKLLEKFLWDGIVPRVSAHCFKESLVRHSFFQRRDGGRGRLPRFFRGL
uniref:F-box associated beta-propeller type 3 domain-containing protein n=1 Tax=Arundo donax TaxID=35708 RepID=A0A0A9C3G3_ARUDO